MLYKVWSLVRRRVTRRLTRLQTLFNVLEYRKIWWNDDEIQLNRNRTGTGNCFNLIMRMTVPQRCALHVLCWQHSWHIVPGLLLPMSTPLLWCLQRWKVRGGTYKIVWIWDQVHAQAPDRSDFDYVKLWHMKSAVWACFQAKYMPNRVRFA